MRNNDLAKAFVNDPMYMGKGSNLEADGNGRLYSYDTCIAQWKGKTLIVNTTRYSCTTSKHIGYVKCAAITRNVTLKEVKDIPFDTDRLV